MIKTINGSPLISALKGLGGAFLSSVVLILISAKILTESSNLEFLVTFVPMFIQLISAFVGGIISGRLSESNGYVSGIICGSLYGGIIFIVSVFTGGFNFIYSVIRLAIIVLISALGSIAFSSKHGSEKKRRKAMLKKLRNN